MSPEVCLFKHALQVSHAVVVAYRDENASGPCLQCSFTNGNFGTYIQIELLEALLGFAACLRVETIRDRKNDEQEQRESDAGDRRNLFGEEIGDGDKKEGQRRRQQA